MKVKVKDVNMRVHYHGDGYLGGRVSPKEETRIQTVVENEPYAYKKFKIDRTPGGVETISPIDGWEKTRKFMEEFQEIFIRAVTEDNFIFPMMTYSTDSVRIYINEVECRTRKRMYEVIDDCVTGKIIDATTLELDYDTAFKTGDIWDLIDLVPQCGVSEFYLNALKYNVTMFIRLVYVAMLSDRHIIDIQRDTVNAQVINLMLTISGDTQAAPMASKTAQKWINRISGECTLCKLVHDPRCKYWSPFENLDFDGVDKNGMHHVAILEPNDMTVAHYRQAIKCISEHAEEIRKKGAKSNEKN